MRWFHGILAVVWAVITALLMTRVLSPNWDVLPWLVTLALAQINGHQAFDKHDKG